MNTFEHLVRFLVPRSIADETDVQLRDAGRSGHERFVLWSGVVSGNEFHTRTMLVPRQRAYRLTGGLCVRVEADELHRLNVWLFEHEERLAIQIHAHPTEAYHSETDNEFPIVTTRGGLSLVVPDFAQRGVRGHGTALYRLSPSGWAEVSQDSSQRLLQIER